MKKLIDLLKQNDIKKLPLLFNCSRTDGKMTLFADGKLSNISEAEDILIPDSTKLQYFEHRVMRNKSDSFIFIVGVWDISEDLEIKKSCLNFRRPQSMV